MDKKSAQQNEPEIVLMCHNSVHCLARRGETNVCPIYTKTYKAILDNEMCCEGLWIPARFQPVAKRKGTEHVDRKAAAKAYLGEYECLS